MIDEVDKVDELLLEHFGTKGMKWGVRNAQKQTAKADAHFEKMAGTVGTWVAVNNRAAQLTNDHDIDRINNKPKYKGMNFSDENAPLTKQYTKEHQDAWIKNLNRAADELGTNVSGTKKYSIVVNPADRWLWGVTTSDVQHVDEIMTVKVKHDKNGRILSLDPVSPMEHSGVKGMKWGVRTKRSGKRDTSRTSFQKSPKKLTTHELEARIKRMETEKKYNELNRRDVSKGSKIASEILGNSGKKVATTVVTGAALLAVKLAIKKKFGEEAASMITKRGK